MFANDFEFRVVSLKRSGHHAIVLWLCGLFEEPALHLNDVELGKDPFATSKGFTFVNELLGKRSPDPKLAKDRKCIILSYEDLDLRRVSAESDLDLRRWLGNSCRVKNLLCLRDPYNMLASRFTLWREDVLTRHVQILEQWRDHAREFLGYTKRLPERLAVNFNRWAMEKNYRQNLCEEVGISFRDIGFRRIPRGIIGGSSFSDRPGPHVRTADLLVRWKSYEADRDFWAFFNSVPEVKELSLEIFGPIVDLKRN